MPKFRKKPVVIEAFQMTEVRSWNNSDWPEWLHEAWNKDRERAGSLYRSPEGANGLIYIYTPEGPLSVSWNDWIIQGVKGEIYPCKPDIFEETYDPVAE